jgi:hypothetical protein
MWNGLKAVFLAGLICVLLFSGNTWNNVVQAVPYNVWTPTTDFKVHSPRVGSVWLAKSDHLLKCDQAVDCDKDLGTNAIVLDTVTMYWTVTNGQFKNNNNIGVQVPYVCPDLPGDANVTIKAHAADAYTSTPPAPAHNNQALAADAAKFIAVDVKCVVPTVVQVGFGGDYAMRKTPTGGNSFDGWGASTNLIQDPVYDHTKDIATNVENQKNDPVCMKKGLDGLGSDAIYLHKVRFQVSTRVTEGSRAVFTAAGTNNWKPAFITIRAGEYVSDECANIMMLDGSLEDKVRKNAAYQLSWKYRVETGLNWDSNINNTTHTVFLTYGVPTAAAAEITVKRMDQVCTWADGKATRKEIAGAVQQGIPLNRTFNEDNNVVIVSDWRLMIPKALEQANNVNASSTNAKFRGYCNDYAEFMKKNLELLGLLGSHVRLIYASTNDSDYLNPEKKELTGGDVYWLKFDFNQNGVVDNNFEGVLEVNVSNNAPATVENYYYAVWPKLEGSSPKKLLDALGASTDQYWIHGEGNQWFARNTFGAAWPPGPQLSPKVPFPTPDP